MITKGDILEILCKLEDFYNSLIKHKIEIAEDIITKINEEKGDKQ